MSHLWSDDFSQFVPHFFGWALDEIPGLPVYHQVLLFDTDREGGSVEHRSHVRDQKVTLCRCSHSYGLGMEVATGSDGVARCSWGASTPDYVPYHDGEWGYPVGDDRTLLEKLCLESFQSGLSWITVLRKREDFRRVFHNFEPEPVATMTPNDVERLLGDATIIRHRGKIESAINNAKRTLEMQRSQTLASFVWAYEPAESAPLAAQTDESVALSKALKQEGFTWLGPTTVYAFMQAMGLVNDHLEGCDIGRRCAEAKARFDRPWARSAK